MVSEQNANGHQRNRVAPHETVVDRPRTTEGRLHEIETRLAEQLRLRQQHVPRNVNRQHAESFSRLDRIALAITTRVGTFGFFLIILTWTVYSGSGGICWRRARSASIPRRRSSCGSSSRT